VNAKSPAVPVCAVNVFVVRPGAARVTVIGVRAGGLPVAEEEDDPGDERGQHSDLSRKLPARARNFYLLVNGENLENQDHREQSPDRHVELRLSERVAHGTVRREEKHRQNQKRHDEQSAGPPPPLSALQPFKTGLHFPHSARGAVQLSLFHKKRLQNYSHLGQWLDRLLMEPIMKYRGR